MMSVKSIKVVKCLIAGLIVLSTLTLAAIGAWYVGIAAAKVAIQVPLSTTIAKIILGVLAVALIDLTKRAERV